jgi:HSP20 family molecular chaperone IbpA
MIKTIEIPQEARDNAERANIERDSRRDILLYIIQNNLNIPQEQLEKYQKEYDEKYLAFEQAKREIEKKYVLPATDGKALNWSLNYSNCIVTINLPDE